MRIRRIIVATVSALALLAACTTARSPRFDLSSVATVTTRSTTSTTDAPTTTRATRATTTTAKPRPPATVQLPAVRGDQAIVVTAATYGATTATVTAYQRVHDGFRAVFGPWAAYVGRKGIAPPGEKREGDGRTPSGSYGIDFMFGTQSNPGVKFPFRYISGPNIVWVEDSNSPNYNRWVDTSTDDAGNQPDNMNKPPYRYGAVIAYNTAERTPGLGSGIFLHVTHDSPTAGCVALPVGNLLKILRWLDPAASPAFVIGVDG
ncbi:MAG: L,D-transpeptidase family protein [Actinobacteria bacterium]|nr:L,D-transpeptidase family protein [Actinomycetota bacterium]